MVMKRAESPLLMTDADGEKERWRWRDEKAEKLKEIKVERRRKPRRKERRWLS